MIFLYSTIPGGYLTRIGVDVCLVGHPPAHPSAPTNPSPTHSRTVPLPEPGDAPDGVPSQVEQLSQQGHPQPGPWREAVAGRAVEYPGTPEPQQEHQHQGDEEHSCAAVLGGAEFPGVLFQGPPVCNAIRYSPPRH